MKHVSSQKNIQVLVIDDTPANLKVVASTLAENGYNVLVATNGKQGISVAQAKLPDLILLDIMMPEMDGYAVCEALKSDEKTSKIPIIFLTAANDIEDIVKGFELGAVDYVMKPFNQFELLARVRNHLELKISKQIIYEQKQELDFAISGSNIGVWNWNLQTNQFDMSDKFIEMLSYSKEEIGNTYFDLLNYVHTDDDDRISAILNDMLNGKIEQFETEFRIQCRKGAFKWILSKGKTIRKDQTSKPLLLVGTHIDITKIKHHEDQIRILSMAVQQSANTIVITDTQGSIVFVNKHYLDTTGYQEKEIIGQNPNIVKSGKQPPEFYKNLWETIARGQEWHGEFCNKKKNGELFWESATITSIKDEKGKIIYYLAIQEDITEKKKMEEELHYYSTTDSLTNTCNRRTGLEMLKHHVLLAKRQNHALTVCFIDLNNLKAVNDTYGHHEGDRYITLVSDQIKAVLRTSDCLVRLGGDEFLIVLPECDIENAKTPLTRLTNSLDEINQSRAYPFMMSISYGFAEYNPQDDPDYEALVEVADNEMYKHKLLYKKSKTDKETSVTQHG